MLNIRNKAAIHLDYVRHIKSEQKEERFHSRALLLRNISYRQDLAADRKSRIVQKALCTITSDLQSKLRRVSQVKSLKDGLRKGLKDRSERQMRAALLRRQFRLQSEVARRRDMNQKKILKSLSVKRMNMETRKYLYDRLQVKSTCAFLRRQEVLIKNYRLIKARNALTHYKVEWTNSCKANQRLAIAEAIERKAISAIENRILFLRGRVLQCATISNFERVKKTRERLFSFSKSKLEMKLKNKVDANSLRYESIMRNQQDKSQKIRANRDLVLVKRKYMLDMQRTIVMTNVSDRFCAVDQKRRLIFRTRVDLLAAKRLKNATKRADAQKYNEQKNNETYDRLISKHLTASERKQEKINSTIMKTPSSEKKERISANVNVSYTKSLNVRTREEIDIQLNDAAERREAILLMRAEQAGFMGSRRTTSNVSPDFIRTCELSYSLSPSSDTSMWVKPLPQCCNQWESPKQFEKSDVTAVNCLNIWMLDIIFQFFIHLSEKIQFVRR